MLVVDHEATPSVRRPGSEFAQGPAWRPQHLGSGSDCAYGMNCEGLDEGEALTY